MNNLSHQIKKLSFFTVVLLLLNNVALAAKGDGGTSPSQVDEVAMESIYNSSFYNPIEDATEFPGENISLSSQEKILV